MRRLAVMIAVSLCPPLSAFAEDAETVLKRCLDVCGSGPNNAIVEIERFQAGWRVTSFDWHITSGTMLKDADVAAFRQIASHCALRIRVARPLDAESVRRLVTIPNLRQLTVPSAILGGSFETLSSSRSLQDLDLTDFGYKETGDAGIAYIANMHSLRRLNLSALGLSDRGMREIALLANLEELDVRANSRITDEGVSQLGSLRKLRAVAIDSLGPRGLRALREGGRLERLQVGTYEDAESSAFSAFSSLRHLGIDAIEGTPKTPLNMPSELVELQVSQSDVAKLNLGSARSVVRVCVDVDVDVRPGDLRWLSSLPALQELTLRYGSEGGWRVVADLPSLRKLSLVGTCVPLALSDEGIRSLGRMPRVESLDIEVSQLTDAGLSAMCNFPNLRRLRLAQTPNLTSNGLTRIRDLKCLKALAIDVPADGLGELPGRVLSPMIHMRGIEDLSFHGKLSDRDVKKLAAITSLKRLDLVDCYGYSASALTYALNSLPQLQLLTAWVECQRGGEKTGERSERKRDRSD